MKREFRILDIEENRDFKLDIKLLLAKLSEVKPTPANPGQYMFSGTNCELFVFLDNSKTRSFLLDNPEDIKILDMDNFVEGQPHTTSDGEVLRTYKQDEYIFAIMDKNK